MAAIVVSAFALALFCFLVLSTICVGTLFAFIYRRYYGIPRSRPIDVEAQASSSASATAKAGESATLDGSPPPNLAVGPEPKSPHPIECSDDKEARPASPQNVDRPTWKRRTLSWVLTPEMQNRFSSLSASLAKVKAKAKEKWAPFESDSSLATMDLTRLSEDDPPSHSKGSSSPSSARSSSSSSSSPSSPSLYSKTTASGNRSQPSRGEKPAVDTMDSPPAPVDTPSDAVEDAPRPSMSRQLLPASRSTASKKSTLTIRSTASKKSAQVSRSQTFKRSPSTSRGPPSPSAPARLASTSPERSTSGRQDSASSEPAPVSSASTPSLASVVSTPATTWEPQTPPASTTIPGDIADSSQCQASPSSESLEIRSTDLNVAALTRSEVILASGSLPSCVSGLSDVIGCLDVRNSLIEDLAKTAIHPTLGLGLDVNWLSQAAISISLGTDLPILSRVATPVSPKVVDARPRRPTVASTKTVNIITEKETTGLDNGSISSDSKTACGPEAPEGKADDEDDDEHYAALVAALSRTFSVASLRVPGSSRHSAASTASAASTSSIPSMAQASDDMDLGLETSYEFSYDASESDFDGFGCSDDESGKSRPLRAADPSPLHRTCSPSEQSVLTM